MIKKEFYEEIYFVANSELLTNKQHNHLLMMGTKNFDSYYTPFNTRKVYEHIKNISLVEFDSENEMFEYMEHLHSVSLLNFSLEHEKPCLLEFV